MAIIARTPPVPEIHAPILAGRRRGVKGPIYSGSISAAARPRAIRYLPVVLVPPGGCFDVHYADELTANSCVNNGSTHADAVFDRLFPADARSRRLPSTTSKNAAASSPPIWPAGSWSGASRAPPTRPRRRPRPARTADAPGGRRRDRTTPGPNASSPHASDPSSSGASAGVVRPVGSSFSPSDEQLGLTQEGYRPAVVRLATRPGAKVAFAEASDDLAGFRSSHRRHASTRLCERVGGGVGRGPRPGRAGVYRTSAGTTAAAAPTVAAVLLDGGRVQTRAAGRRSRRPSDPRWQETKVACCLSLRSSEKAVDPQPEPPAKLLEAAAVARLAAEMKARRFGRGAADGTPSRPPRRRRGGGGGRGPGSGSGRWSRVWPTVTPSASRWRPKCSGGGWGKHAARAACATARSGTGRCSPCTCCRGALSAFWISTSGFLPVRRGASGGRADGAGGLGVVRALAALGVGRDRCGRLRAALREAASRLGAPPAGAKEDDARGCWRTLWAM